MIARIWSGRTTAAQSQSYLVHFSESVRPALRKLDGYAGATVLTRSAGSNVEITVTTFWQSMQAIERFAGPDREAAVVAPEAAALLTDFDKRATHCEVALADLPLTFASK